MLRSNYGFLRYTSCIRSLLLVQALQGLGFQLQNPIVILLPIAYILRSTENYAGHNVVILLALMLKISLPCNE